MNATRLRKFFRGRTRSAASEHGQVLVLFAGGLVVFLGLVGLSLDVGQLVQTRTDLQKTADAGAFAGAQDLPTSADAIVAADAYVTSNRDGATTRQVQITTTNETNDTITVTATDTVNYIFLGLLGSGSASVSASATVRVDIVTGYTIDETDIFPYAVWGGATNSGGGLCPTSYGICAGSVQTFRSNSYRADTDAAGPDWAINGNNFKGYFHAGTGVAQVDTTSWQTFSRGGNAIGQEPIAALLAHAADPNSPIIVPVIAAASCVGGCGTIDFKIVAWVALQLDPAFVANPSIGWTGTVMQNFAISKGETTGTEQPPSSIATRTFTFVA